jgi:hypothetical protein
VKSDDLSAYGTKRGLRIGSTYADVLALCGGKRHAHRGPFVVGYAATVPERTVALPHRVVALPQRIVIVLDDDRVTSITIEIEESALFLAVETK